VNGGPLSAAHAADDVTDTAPVGERRGEGEEHQIAPGHERIGQAVLTHLDRDIAGQRGIGNLRQRRNLQRMTLTELFGPIRPQRFDARQQTVTAFQFDRMPLAVAEAEHFDACEPLQGPGKAGRGILSAGEQHQCGFRLQLIAHPSPLSIPPPRGQSVEIDTISTPFHWDRGAACGIKRAPRDPGAP